MRVVPPPFLSSIPNGPFERNDWSCMATVVAPVARLDEHSSERRQCAVAPRKERFPPDLTAVNDSINEPVELAVLG